MGIEKRGISDQVLRHLRRRIMLKEIQEGEYLRETELSIELNVSRGPIREALAKLEAENLVKKNSNGRTVVKKFGLKDITDLYDSRILLESHALTQIEKDVLDNKKDLLYRYVDQMQESYERKSRNVDSDLAFHGLLVHMTKNNTLIQLWTSLSGMLETLIEITNEYTEPQQQEIIHDHILLADALVAGDVEKAQELLTIHLKEASEYFCDAVQKLSTGGIKHA
ncbi:GntR family transcriptional regulator [Planococcus shenhongbingii]|uniref:GntR family transcriptional regulator n=1 Tax=Planococcus shenhongbingii TaxID=3058398 RepID=A0ABT8NEB1_9BACL|nr:GntR family transcriptional regulator [Planococcus sp. N017]MDN7246234.1 GntR family transcriptional regulator [Planococcus sp. N017]